MIVYFRTVTLAFWLGALLAIDIIETPVRVRTETVPRPYRFAIGGRVFKWFSWVQVLFGVGLTGISIPTQSGPSGWKFYGAIVMLLLTLVQALWLGPSMSNRMAVHEPQGGVELEIRPGFKLSHILYIGVDAVKTVLLIYLISKQ